MALSAQRQFHHLRVPYGEDELTVPLVVLLHHDDVGRLAAAARDGAVVDDLLAILRQHGASILPMLAPGAAGAVVLPAGAGGGRGAVASYHGELVSAQFELRVDDEGGRYTLMAHAPGAAEPHLRPVPVAGFTLLAHVRHKAADVERRRAALLGDGGSVFKHATSAAAAAAGPPPG
jgi:hypothetical protein